MKYRVTFCGGLLATAVLLSFPHASSALPAAPSGLLPAVHSSDLIIVRGGGGRGVGGGGHVHGGGGGWPMRAVAAARLTDGPVAAVRPTCEPAVAT